MGIIGLGIGLSCLAIYFGLIRPLTKRDSVKVSKELKRAELEAEQESRND